MRCLPSASFAIPPHSLRVFFQHCFHLATSVSRRGPSTSLVLHSRSLHRFRPILQITCEPSYTNCTIPLPTRRLPTHLPIAPRALASVATLYAFVHSFPLFRSSRSSLKQSLLHSKILALPIFHGSTKYCLTYTHTQSITYFRSSFGQSPRRSCANLASI